MFQKEDSLKKKLVVKQKTSCSHGVFCYCINFLIFRLYEDFRNSKLKEALPSLTTRFEGRKKKRKKQLPPQVPQSALVVAERGVCSRDLWGTCGGN